MRLLLATFLFALSYAQTACESTNECGTGEFCNFDNGASGTCERCDDIRMTCSRDNFITSQGEAECESVCEPNGEIHVNMFRVNPGFYTCAVVTKDDDCFDDGGATLLGYYCLREANCPDEDGEYIPDPVPDGECPCIGLPEDVEPTEFQGYGAFCFWFDSTPASPFYNICTAAGADWCGTENWCVLSWCYVDPNDADCTDYVESSTYPGNYYSYFDACGTPDCYECSYDSDVDCPDACPIIPDNLNCDCPAACRGTWVGDGTCDRRETGTNCEFCENFWSGGAVNEGTFDGGDCDNIVSTTTDPHAIHHNDVVVTGHSQCVHSQGICESVSFSAPTFLEEDPDDLGNNYDCLTTVATKAWFIIQLSSGGEFHADMLATSPVDYIIWGPFDDVASAMGDCGTLSSAQVQQCSYNTGRVQHVLDIENTNAGEVYIIMISDNNLSPAIITIDAENSEAALDCDVILAEGYECVSEPSILVDFFGAEVARHNLGNRWAESVGLDGEVPLGTYYRSVGWFETQQLGLLVTTTTPEQYECNALHPDGNKCADVLGGAQLEDESDLVLGYDFGQVNMYRGDVTLKLQFVKDTEGTESGTPLGDGETFDRLKLTIFDIDSGFAEGEGLEIVRPMYVCPGAVVTQDTRPPYVQEDRERNILDFSENDFSTSAGFQWNPNTGCYESKSDPPTGTFVVKQQVECRTPEGGDMPCKENNPTGVNELTTLAQSMSVEAEFHDVTSDGVELIVHVSREHSKARNIWFAGQSDSIGRICCKDVFDEFVCLHGYRNGNMECGFSTTAEGLCTPEFCCDDTPPPSSHGDPIIHTYHGDCYDLHQDGNWLASAHPAHDHEVHIAVYNDYMRQVSVTNSTGDIMLAINNYGEILNNDYPYHLDKKVLPCPEDYHLKDCIGEYVSISFDAQDLYWDIHAQLRHDYNDNALRDGEVGFHMDVYPQPYIRKFKPRLDEYTGLYFHNPLPEELLSCDQREQS